MHTAYTYDPTHVGHVHANHPEKPQRAHLAFNTLERDGILGTLACLDPVPNPEAAITRVHPQDYYDLLRETQKRAPFLFGFDTYVTPESFGIAERGVGALLALTDAVADGTVDNGFALVRPPGHHARPFEAMGFCFFANVAIAVQHARAVQGAERVLVVDFDVHHGNGTQEVFYDDPNVLVVSSHQYPFYPGTGALQETGEGRGVGATLNLPLPPNVGDAGILELYRRTVLPTADRFKPDMVFVSAGFDAHHLDPLGETALSIRGFADLVLLCMEIADQHCDDRLVCALEGGYHVDVVAHSVLTTLRLLQDPHAPTSDPFGAPSSTTTDDLSTLIGNVRELHGLG